MHNFLNVERVSEDAEWYNDPNTLALIFNNRKTGVRMEIDHHPKHWGWTREQLTLWHMILILESEQ